MEVLDVRGNPDGTVDWLVEMEDGKRYWLWNVTVTNFKIETKQDDPDTVIVEVVDVEFELIGKKT